MEQGSLRPTPDQTFELIGKGEYDFTAVLRNSYDLQDNEHRIEEACNERFQAFRRIAELIPEDEDITLEWNHDNTRSALEIISASAIDHFLINDFEMAAGMIEMLLDLDPEDHTESVETLAFCYVAMEEYELFDEIINDISDKSPAKHLLLMWAAFRRTGIIPEGEMRMMSYRHRFFLNEFRADDHPIDDDYMFGMQRESPTQISLARQLWLQTEHLWKLFPDFIEALKQA